MTEPTLIVDGEPVAVTYLDLANATPRTAPRVGDVVRSRDVLRPGQVAVPRDLLVALLDAWQAACDAELPSLTEPAAFVDVERAQAREALDEALAAFAAEVTP